MQRFCLPDSRFGLPVPWKHNLRCFIAITFSKNRDSFCGSPSFEDTLRFIATSPFHSTEQEMERRFQNAGAPAAYTR